ncbi:MAG TPA: hypothetical protein VFE45_05435, partial [Coriobacteriia bacterium]|nr:hypothetical protein [Coriobacteriia bacterium]
LGLAVPSTGEDDGTGHTALRPSWSFDWRALGVDLGEQRVLVARNGQLIKGRDSSSSATWEAVAEPLSAYRLASVSLRGIRRSVTVDAEQSPDVRGDVEEVAQSLEDQYFLTHATVRVPAPGDREGTTDIDVNFGAGTLHASTGASLRDLTSVAARVLNYRGPATDAQVAALVSGDYEDDAWVHEDDPGD